MTNYNVDFEKFNEDFFQRVLRETDRVTYFDKTIVRQLSGANVAEISLVTTGVKGHYTAYDVRIVNKANGLIAHHVFHFGDYFEKENRVDNRPDYKNGKPHINVSTCDKDIASWYIIIPAPFEIDRLAKRILDYIDLYN